MNPKSYKKPVFYFNSQKTARVSILWIAAISIFFLWAAFASLQSYKTNGFISVPQRSGPWIDIYGPNAMTTIYFYVGCSIFFFALDCYFSACYLKIRKAQEKSSKVIVPEKCVPEKVFCPSCLFSQPVYFSSNMFCPRCNTQMEDVTDLVDKQTFLKKNEKSDSSIWNLSTETLGISIAVICISALLLKLFSVIFKS